MYYMADNHLIDLFTSGNYGSPMDGTNKTPDDLKMRLNRVIFNRMAFLDILKMNSAFSILAQANQLIAAKIPEPMSRHFVKNTGCLEGSNNNLSCKLVQWIDLRVLQNANGGTDNLKNPNYSEFYHPVTKDSLKSLMEIVLSGNYSKKDVQNEVWTLPATKVDVTNPENLA